MIEKMKKVFLVVLTRDRDTALKNLAGAQVFHPSLVYGTSNSLVDLQAQRAHVALALEAIPKGVKCCAEQIDILSVVNRIHRQRSILVESEEHIRTSNRELQRTHFLTAFDKDDLNVVLSAGLCVGLYMVPYKEYSGWQSQWTHSIFKIKVHKGFVVALMLTKNKKDLPEEYRTELPVESFKKLREVLDESTLSLRQAKIELTKLSVYKASIRQYLATLDEKIEFEMVYSSMVTDGDVSYLEGYIPASAVLRFKDLCQEHAWALLCKDVSDEDEQVPTLIKNFGVGALVRPLLVGLDLLPGYREFDITSVMFFFFTVFFAMIIGDAGYGILFSIVGILMLTRRLLKGNKVGPGLFYFLVLSLSVVVWGALTGNWFGYSGFTKIPFLARWIQPWLMDANNLMRFCFWLGTAHLLIAHSWAIFRAVRQNFLSVFAQLGHFLMIFSLQYLVYLLLLREKFPGDWVVSVIFVGYTLVLLFSYQKPGLNPFKQMLIGLANIFPTTLGCVSNFSDIISYIRLYAVGLAGLSIAQAFNGMVLNLPKPYIFFLGPLLLLMAHSINIMLGLLSVVVHGLRLNSLEFASHLGLEWKGIIYKPFGKRKASTN